MSPSSSSPPRFGVSDFERIYAASGDPWGYETSAYEREKYAATLAALPARPLGRVLEVGCSIGVFSEQLAGRCAELVAIDFAARALELARERLAGVGNVSLSRASFPEQTPPGEWDVVVCSEVLYYLDRPTLERALEWLAARLDRGATVVAGRGGEWAATSR